MCVCLFACLMVFNVIFNNMSVISWRSVLLVEETGGPGENHRPVASHTPYSSVTFIPVYTPPSPILRNIRIGIYAFSNIID